MSNVPECSFCGENKVETVLFLTEENGPMICLSCVQGFLAINQERENKVLKRRKKSCSGVLERYDPKPKHNFKVIDGGRC